MNNDEKLRDYLKKVTLELRKTQARLQEAETGGAADPIAIVGLSCRCPDRVQTPEEFWRLLVDERDCIGAFPTDRGWDADAIYDSDPGAKGKSYVRSGGFLRDVADFDAAFFGISPREALAADPQQRLLLEASWEALEHAGIQPASLNGTATGVFLGLAQNNYSLLGSSPELEGYIATGNSPSVASGRISYTLGLQGPAVSVDTACSASLVALHLACQSLRQGECELALAGGATVIPSLDPFVEFSRQRALAPDGRCKPFSAHANGTAWGEAAGMLVLERLSDAQRNGHRVLALIRGSAINQDGKSQGLTAPNGLAQELVIRQALSHARLSALDVDAVEAHGTGTNLGDPIEAEALLATYGRDRSSAQPLWLGSVKSNLGHTQAAAGVIGVIKLVLALEHELLPKSLHAEEPTPHVDWSSGSVQLLREARAWKRSERRRRAAVSSFGISGTNAHLILEEAPLLPDAAPAVRTYPGEPLPFIVSAKSAAALRAQAERLRSHVLAHPELSLPDVAYSLVTTRSSHEVRAVAVAEGRDDLLAALQALSEGEASAALVLAQARASGKVVFVFPGQGGQWRGMARELLASSPVFAEQLQACAQALAPFIDWSLLDALASDDEALLQRIDVVQPLLFAVMVSLAALWRSQGIEPDAVVGHSQGEIAAAYVAGALSLSDAARVVALRSRAMRKLTGLGGMAAVELSAAALRERLVRFGGRLSIAAANAPNATIVTGELDALDALLDELQASQILARRVRSSVPGHCALTDRIEAELRPALAGLVPRPSTLALYSTLHAELVSGESMDADYWFQNARQTVRFEEAVQGLLASGHRFFVEVSAHPVLTQAVQSCADAAQTSIAAVGTLRRDQGGLSRFLLALGELHARGLSVDWSRTIGAARKVALPTYAFQRERYWLASDASLADVTTVGLVSANHPLLGASVVLADGGAAVFTARFSLASHGWLYGHRLHGTSVLPATALVELAVAIAHRLGLDTVEELTLSAPCILPEQGALQMQLSASAADESGARSLRVHSRTECSGAEGVWTQHASGTLRLAAHEQHEQHDQDAPAALDASSCWPPEGAEPLELDGLYDELAAVGVDYGADFRGLCAAYRRGDDLFAEVKLPDCASEDAARYGLHPALLDASLQVLGLRGKIELTMPFAWQGVRLRATGVSALRVRLRVLAPEQISLVLMSESGEVVGEIAELRMRPASAADLRRANEVHDALFHVEWTPVPTPAPASTAWVSFGDPLELPVSASVHYHDLAALGAALDAGQPAPAVVVWACPSQSGVGVVEGAHAASHHALAVLQAWLADKRLAASRLVVVTRAAVAAAADDRVAHLALAPVWGLLRALQAEAPDLDVSLLDLEDTELSDAASSPLMAALTSPERQLALRHGALYAPRLARSIGEFGVPQALSADGTVLISGGTGALGGLLAQHLVAKYGVRHLLLCSRSGGAAALQAQLEAQGASVRVVACDISQRVEVAALIDSIPQDRPLCAVFHTAVALADGVFSSQSAQSLDHVFAAKLTGAWHLHELTRDHALQAFVMFSSLSGVLGGLGMSNYAAANAFLDALAQHRRAQGLVGTSLAWGLWGLSTGLSGSLQQADAERMQRHGMQPLAADEGCALLDAALAANRALMVPARFDPRLLAEPAESLPAVLRGLARRRLPRGADESTASAASFRARLASLGTAQRTQALLDAIGAAVTTVMGVPASRFDAERPLSELGLDSLMAVELRNRLAALTKLRLPATLLFDHPSPNALCRYLESRLSEKSVATPGVQALVQPPLTAAEPIALVAMSCRYPGGVDSPETLWQLLAAGTDTVGSFPNERGWDEYALFDPDPDAAGKSTVCKGAFLQAADTFDAAFFGIGPREALAMDPQQRLLLETAWEALERSGLDPSSLRGTATGVFVGLSQTDYAQLGLPAELEAYSTGVAASVASGRIAYCLGLHGPAVTLDTACSSSLVAIHFACQSLLRGECSLALAGGATVMATTSLLSTFSRLRGLSPDGRCKAFSNDADGTGLGEGAGMLVLERLSDAQRNGHPVLALIRGSAINQDGRSQGLTAPNGPAQEQVIRQALASAQLPALAIDAVEAHGTGTMLGDPIEAEALLATYGSERSREQPLWLGSLKTNIGHTQAAGGVGGIIKLVLALEHELLPKSLHAEVPTQHVDWSAGSVRLLHEAVAWKRNGRPRRAGVSSFGISGTNAHLILEEPPTASKTAIEVVAPSAHGCLPFVVCARSHVALRAQAARLHAHLLAHPELSLLDVAYSLASTRAAFEVRAVLIAESREALLESLAELARLERRVDASDAARANGELAILFTGQGSQRLQMGSQLYECSPVFRAALDAVFDAFASELAVPLRDVMFGAADSEQGALLDTTGYAQPALFALEVALYRLLEASGVTPRYLLGHSLGEISAAHVAGVMSLKDACTLVAARARLMQALPAGGAMATLEVTPEELRAPLEQYAGRVSIAALNGPRSVVVSGDADAVDELARSFVAQGRKQHRLAVSHAFHSAHMEPMLAEFERVVSGLTLRPAQLAIVSNVSGELLASDALCAPSYWVEQVRATVRFHPALGVLRAAGVNAYLELGPQAVLATLVHEAELDSGSSGVCAWSALRKGRHEMESWLTALGSLYEHGHHVAWKNLFELRGGRVVALPTYAFQGERFWLEPSRFGRADSLAAIGLELTDHPLLDSHMPLAEAEATLFVGRLSRLRHEWLSDHVVYGQTILPGTAFVELALAAAHRVGSFALDELVLEAALPIPERGGVQIQVAVAAADDAGARTLTLHARNVDAGEDAAWTRHATGVLRSRSTSAVAASAELRNWPPAGAQELELSGFYERLSAAGIAFGAAFRCLQAVYVRDRELFAEVALPDELTDQAGRYGLHPALFDAAMHALLLQEDEIALPFVWQGVSLHKLGAAKLRVRLSRTEPGQFSLEFADASGELVGRVETLRARPPSAAAVRTAGQLHQALFGVDWVSMPAREDSLPSWAMLGEAAAGLPEPELTYPNVAALAAALDAGVAAPAVVVLPCLAESAGELVASASAATARTLAVLQAWLADERLAASRLVVLTRGAIGAGIHDADLDLAHAPLWGLVRAAQAEYPTSGLRLLDLDEAACSLASRASLLRALASREPQLALRDGAVLVPRLVRQRALPPSAAGVTTCDLTHGTVLITGGSGTLAGLLAEHLVVRHGVRQLVLCSRSARTDALVERLATLGASIRVAACDVSQRAQVEALLASIPAEHPLIAVMHTAAVVDDGVLSAQTAARFDRVFAPKLAGAWHLHELTRDRQLAAFVLFSSIAGTLGGPGQSNYSAANSFLDALAQQRKAQGLAATSLAWGHWADRSGLTTRLGRADLERLARTGIEAMSAQEALALFDIALDSAAALLVPNRFAARVFATPADELPAMLRGLGRVRLAQASAAAQASGSLQDRLNTLDGAARERLLLDSVLAAVSSTLGVAAAAVAPDRPLSELGLDSLTALDLRNQLALLSGLRMPASLLFDHPTPKALGRFLEARLRGDKLQARPLAATTPVHDPVDPIAIVAMSCRYPGGVDSPEALWQLLEEERDAISAFPNGRGWNADELYDPDPDVPGKSLVTQGGFLHEAADFDAAFFGITPREALATDPQQRLLLETAWEALERAHLSPTTLQGSATGVFVGIMYNDYASRFALGGAGPLEGQLAVGSAASVASGRIAYSLGLHGPAITVDTACSSSLVALHLAGQALRHGECELALCGGATVMATPRAFVDFSRQRGLASDGRCKSFSDAADGVAWSEGVGMLVLARLSDARRKGYPVLALLRGSAVNQDGKSQGLTAPNGPAQEQVIQQALANAGLVPADIDAVEGHGTGTTLGDPIEAQALLSTYGAQRAAAQPLWLGSLKSNLGHTQAAAGVGGVIELVLALQHRMLPKTLHAQVPTQHVDWSEGGVKLLQEAQAWQAYGRPRRAGVSSFGISGTNAHVILEEAPTLAADTTQRPSVGLLPFVVSGHSDAALRAQAARLMQHVLAHPALTPLDLAYSLATTRGAFDARAVVLAHDRATLLSELEKLAAGESTSHVLIGQAAADAQLAMLFSGQGSQRAGMGLGLYQSFPQFRSALDAVFAGFAEHLERPLADVMFAEPGSADAALLDRTAYTQPALFALEVALYRLLEHWGVRPKYLLGHSVGEIAAAHVAGVMSLGDACTMVAARARLMQALPEGGAMLAIEASEEELVAWLEPGVDLSLAAVNGPRSVVVSGDEALVCELQQLFEAQGRKVRRLAVSHAFHSARMEPMLEAFERVVRELPLQPATLAIASNVSGELAPPELFRDPAYWVNQLRGTVRFHAGVQAVQTAGAAVYLELGPQAVLSVQVEDALLQAPGANSAFSSEPSAARVWPTLRKHGDERESLLQALAALHVNGARSTRLAGIFRSVRRPCRGVADLCVSTPALLAGIGSVRQRCRLGRPSRRCAPGAKRERRAGPRRRRVAHGPTFADATAVVVAACAVRECACAERADPGAHYLRRR